MIDRINSMGLPREVVERLKEWLGPDYDDDVREEIEKLVNSGNKLEILDRFGSELDFGTGGLRGIIGIGSSRMNVYNVRKATQGLANYIKKQGDEFSKRGVVIAYDSRRMSDVFALETALVMAGNGIKAHLFDSPAPTPELSFAVRHLGACAGVVITASHNPPEYNGYKVFWEDGAQVVPPHDKGIIAEVKQIKSLKDVRRISKEDAEAKGLIQTVGKDVDEAYVEKVLSLMLNPDVVKGSADRVKIVYSALHGTGGRLMPEVLKRAGFEKVYLVEEQMKPDGNFPTVGYPNPEKPEAMKLALELGEKMNADLVFASDPDADRIGVGLRDKTGKLVLINGNQIGSLLTYYIISEMKKKGLLPKNPFVVKTIVTTDLIAEISEDFGVEVEETLTGFKYIGEKIRLHEQKGDAQFVFGAEESHGYLAGTFVRDKDSIIAGLLFAEFVAVSLNSGKSPLGVLNEIYSKYGYFREKLEDITLKGVKGKEKINRVMEQLRSSPVNSVAGGKLVRFVDIRDRRAFEISADGEKDINHPYLNLPQSNVLVMYFDNGLKIIARPSGTEPKIKFYFSARGKFEDRDMVDSLVREAVDEFLGKVGLK